MGEGWEEWEWYVLCMGGVAGGGGVEIRGQPSVLSSLDTGTAGERKKYTKLNIVCCVLYVVDVVVVVVDVVLCYLLHAIVVLCVAMCYYVLLCVKVLSGRPYSTHTPGKAWKGVQEDLSKMICCSGRRVTVEPSKLIVICI